MGNYKIAKIVGMHYKGVERIYAETSGLSQLSYQEQKEYLRRLHLVHFNAFSQCMDLLGNEAEDFIYDVEILQKTWASENGVNNLDVDWRYDILFEQIKKFKADVVYFQDFSTLVNCLKRGLRTRYKFIRYVVLYNGFPQNISELGNDVDLILTATPRINDEVVNVGINSVVMYHSFDETIFDDFEMMNNGRNSENDYKYSVTFLGSSGFGYSDGHHSRYWSLCHLLEKTNIKLWISELEVLTSNNLIFCPKHFLPMQPLKDRFKDRCRDSVFGLQMYDILDKSKITFNIHTDAAIDCVGNMRLFEATGIGTCLLTDTGKNMADLFEEDREVVTYRSMDECVEKVNYLLAHDDERKKIAEAGKKRTLKDHTLMHRCQEIDTVIKKNI